MAEAIASAVTELARWRVASTASIPVSSLGTENYSANNWSGLTTPATTAHGEGLKHIVTDPDIMLAMGLSGRHHDTSMWRSVIVAVIVGSGVSLPDGFPGPRVKAILCEFVIDAKNVSS